MPLKERVQTRMRFAPARSESGALRRLSSIDPQVMVATMAREKEYNKNNYRTNVRVVPAQDVCGCGRWKSHDNCRRCAAGRAVGCRPAGRAIQAMGSPGASPAARQDWPVCAGVGDWRGKVDFGGRATQSPQSESVRPGLTPHFCNLLVDGPANSRYTPPHSLESRFQGFPRVLPNCLDDRSQ